MKNKGGKNVDREAIKYMHKKQLVTISMLLMVAVVTGATYSSEIPSGYGKVKFGMSKERVKQILQEEGRIITYETKEYLLASSRKEDKLFGKTIQILYFFNPFTQECIRINILFLFPSEYNAEKLYVRIGTALTEKYGKAESITDYISKWGLENISISLVLSSDGSVSLIYGDESLVKQYEQMQRQFDKKIDKESIGKL